MAGKRYEKMQAVKKDHQDYLDQFKPGTKVASKVYIDQGKQGTVVSVDSEKLLALIDFGDKKENRELHRLKVET